MAKIIAKQTIEQGLSRKFGGAFKLVAVNGQPTEYACEATKDGEAYRIIAADGHERMVPKSIVRKLVELEYVTLEK